HVVDTSAPGDTKGVSSLVWNEVQAGEPVDASGRPTSGLPYGLAQGVVGLVGDAESGYSVIVDEETITQEEMEERLDGGLPSSKRDSVEVEPSCRDASLLAEAWRAVHDIDWASYAGGERVGIYLDAADERVVVESVAAKNLAPGIEMMDAELAAFVRLDTLQDMELTSRMNDEAPWNGGLRINRANGSFCTGGFTVIRRSTNTRAMVTAGHCSGNGIVWRNGSDDDLVGTSTARSNYPEYDQMLLVGSSYTPRIWVGGGTGDADADNLRTVTGAADPAEGQEVCTSGSVSGALCDWDVRSLSASDCSLGPGQCTTYVIRAVRVSGTAGVQNGDSGGPVYTKPGANAATIRGIIIARGENSAGQPVMWAERYRSIAGHLDVYALIGTP
ncbi:S1 family peptidase, partial [Nocardioides dubius]